MIPHLVTPVGSRTNVNAKAIEILLERRLTVRLCHRGRIFAECRGSDTTYELGFTNGRWFCGCENKGTCSHLRALHHVCVKPDA